MHHCGNVEIQVVLSEYKFFYCHGVWLLIISVCTSGLCLVHDNRRRRRRKLYFNNLLHVHLHTSMKYMIYDTVGY